MGFFEYALNLAIMIELLATFTIAFKIQKKAGWDNLGIIFIAGLSAYAFSVFGLIGIALGVLLSLLIGLLSYKIEKLYFALFTLVLLIISTRLVSLDFFVPFTNGQAGKFVSQMDVFFPLTVCLAVIFVLSFLLNKKIGLFLRAVHQNETRFVLLGKNPGFYKVCTWVFSGTLASIGGFFMAVHFGYINPSTFGWLWVNSIIAAALFPGALLGPAVIIIIPETARLIDATGNGAAIQQAVISLTVLLMLWRGKLVKIKRINKIFRWN